VKPRPDSWAASLSEEQSWALYYKARGLRWNEAADWAVKEFGCDAPSRTAFYAWQKRMRSEESAHRLEQAAISSAEAAALAKEKTKDAATVDAFKAIAVDLALRTGNSKDAERFIQAAVAVQDRILKERELALKNRAQETKDEQLKLAREKFEAAEKRLDAVKNAVGDEEISDAERVAKVRSIFGLK